MDKRGSVFIIFLWVMLLVSLFAMSVSFRTRLATKISGYEYNRFQRNYDYLTAANAARFLIDSDTDSNIDSKQDPWYGHPKGMQNTELKDFDDRFKLNIVDEESKLNLNAAPEIVITKLIEILKKHDYAIKTDPKKIAGMIVTWRGGFVQSGSTTIGKDLKKAPLESVDELYLLPEISKTDIELLKPFVTVYGKMGNMLMVNINTVHPYVLEALIYGLAGSDSSKEKLFQRVSAVQLDNLNIEDNQRKQPQLFNSANLNIDTFMDLVNIDKNDAVMRNLIFQFLRNVTTNSEFFSIHIETKSPSKKPFYADVILGPRITSNYGGYYNLHSLARPGNTMNIPLEVLFWHEGY